MPPQEFDMVRINDPLDAIEQVAAINDWSFERSGEDEITILVSGVWADYSVSFSWMEDCQSLHLACAFDLRVPERRRLETMKLVSTINQQLIIGHFDLWFENSAVMYRQALPLHGGISANDSQIEYLLKNALDACERYFQAFQFVVWAGKIAPDALDSVLFETQGEA